MRNVLQPVVNWLNRVFEEEKQDHKKNTIAVLDGVRALAIIFVITFHINWTNKNYLSLWDWRANPLASSVAIAGGTGVTLFFVLSGFLLFMPYAKSLLFDVRWPLARTFYLRRALRIMPGYYLSLFVLILLTAPEYLRPDHLFDLTLFLTFFMDSSADVFRHAINGPYWTLAVEWQFYMFLPVLMLLFFLVVKRVPLKYRLRAVVCCLLTVIALGLGVRYAGFYFQGNSSATLVVPRPVLNAILFFTFGQTGKYIEDFAVGMLVSLCYIYAQSLGQDQTFPARLRRLSPWFWSLGMILLVFSAMWHFQSDPHNPAWPFLNPIMPYFNWLSEMVLAWAYGLCILAMLSGSPALQRPFRWKPLRWIGLISYGLYIWHLPLLVLFETRVLVLWPGLNFYAAYALYWLWAALVIVPFCTLIYNFVEKPCIALGDRWRKAIEQRYRARHQPAPGSGVKTSPNLTTDDNVERLDQTPNRAVLRNS